MEGQIAIYYYVVYITKTHNTLSSAVAVSIIHNIIINHKPHFREPKKYISVSINIKFNITTI